MPSQCSADGGWCGRPTRWVGLYSVRSGAKTATRMTMSEDGDADEGLPVVEQLGEEPHRSGPLQSRIEQHIAQIDEEVRDEHGGRHDQQLPWITG